MTIAEDDPRQPFQQAADTLRQEIRGGGIKPGQRLGSVRQLADRFQISPTTVQRALAVLRDEGLLKTTSRGNFARDEESASQTTESGSAGGLTDVLRELSELRSRVERLESARSGESEPDEGSQ
ncbi:winged helix-turn-helix transcriptional regulator [Streptomyces sp. SID13666]|uniref:GntR family transcriptional regulator n=1 Tax=unclassified Streptomyces TaxID=2593676 RepID=UPI0013C13B49|nr:winged helix-turn-helix transcriptional regulator [Streptomyces sp. SID13666]NEA72829.1 winged helix-turn-helix transcriptional regulator [Streptomyces sp. SID13588]